MNTERFLRWVTLALNLMIAPVIGHTASSALSPFEGKWIQNEHIRAYVATEPYLRILALGPVDGETALLGPQGGLRSGIRLIALEKMGNTQAELLFDEAARYVSATEDRVTVETQAGTGADQVRLEVTIHIPKNESSLAFSCTLSSASERSRTLALWAIASLDPKGWIVTPLSRGFENRQWVHGKVVAYWTTPLDPPSLRLGTDVLAVDLGRWPGSPDLKYGTRSNAGWIAALRPDLSSLLMATAPYSPADVFPDEDCNITIWLGTHPDFSKYAEMEWLGPWTDVPAEGSLSWNFAIEHRKVSPASLEKPEDVLTHILAPQKMSGPAQDKAWTLSADGSFVKDHLGRVTRWLAGGKKIIASAPFWANAPRVSSPGSLEWNADTFVEVDQTSLPAWSPRGRSWEIAYTPARSPGSEPAILFQEGDAATGICLTQDSEKITAWIWDAQGKKIDSVSMPAPETARLSIRLTYDASAPKLALQINGRPDVTRALSFHPKEIPTVLAVGRPVELPAVSAMANTSPFSGFLHKFSITDPSQP